MAEFAAPANSCQGAAERQAAKGAKLTNVEAGLILHNRQSELEREQKTLTMSENVFLQSIGDRPRAYRSKLQKAWYEGPNARRDAEESERTRWLSSLADIVAKSPTPMGRLLCSQPGNIDLLGGGRTRVRELRKFFAWFSVTCEEEFPTTEEHFTGFLRARASEPCNRGALKATHRSFGFLAEVTGMPLSERRTKSKLCDVILRELLSTALPGKPAKQTPRFAIKVLTAVESFVVGDTKPAYMRMYAWWVFVAELVHVTLLRKHGHQSENCPRGYRILVHAPGKVKDDGPGQERANATTVPRRSVFLPVPRLKIQTMQKAVIQSISNPSSKDPLGEAETLTHLEQHFSLSLQHVQVKVPDQPWRQRNSHGANKTSGTGCGSSGSFFQLVGTTARLASQRRSGTADRQTQDDGQCSHTSSGEQPT